MKKKIKAIFFDIDGTLRDFETGNIPESGKKGLALAREAGVKLFIATGRHKLELEEENLLEGLEFDGYVTLNGQYCYHSDKAIFKNPIASVDVAKMAAMAMGVPFPCMFMEADRMYINMVDDFVIHAQNRIATAIPPVEDISGVQNREIYQMVPYVKPDMEAEIMKQLSFCQSTRWDAEYALDLTPKEGDKCLGIEKMLEIYDLSLEEIAAVGDGYNDVTMLSFVGTGIAMGNGCEEAKAAADYVTDRIEHDGLLNAIYYLLNL